MTWPFPYDDPSTLAGQLQRGLGRGFLAALDAPITVVHSILLDCILHESRLDHQIDARGWYYGELAHRTGLPVEPLEALLVAAVDDEAGDGWLAIGVLGHLAIRGRQDAVDVLRRYTDYGGWWTSALLELGRTERPETWRGLDAVAVRRLRKRFDVTVYMPGDIEPFLSFRSSNPEFASLIAARETSSGDEEGETRPLEFESTATLLEPPLTSLQTRASALRTRGTGEDIRLLSAALGHRDPQVRAVAAFALASQGAVSPFETAKQLLLGLRGWRGLAVARYATDALAHLPAALVLPLAREWRSSRRLRRRKASFTLLEVHADSDDIPWIRSQLRRASTIDGENEVVVAANLAKRLWHPAMLDDLRRHFVEMRSSTLRTAIASALSDRDPVFASTFAVESLWDCEAAIRAIAIEEADPRDSRVRARIREISLDPAEHEDIRQAARDRLAGMAIPGEGGEDTSET